MQFHHYNKSEYRTLPEKPGIYKFFNVKNNIIYIGKAKNIRNRVSSYFSKQSSYNRKTYKLVKEIHSIQVMLVDSESDALHLENSLIKENQPKYNILLKDDKSFPYIVITHERFPQIYSTRRVDRSSGEYFGPYTSVKSMNSVLDLIRKLYKIRTCNYNLSADNIAKKKFKVCLEYHIGNCLGPCEGFQTEENYNQEIQFAREILKGKLYRVRQSYKEKMSVAAQEYKYEIAEDYKHKIEYLEKFQEKTFIVNPRIGNTDIITLIYEDNRHYVNFIQLISGSIAASETAIIKSNLDEPIPEIIAYALAHFQSKFSSPNKQVLSNVNFIIKGQEISTPNRGDKKRLIDISEKNAKLWAKERRKKSLERQNIDPKLEVVRKDLRLENLPKHIECFDNSNIQGSNPVASMVCFKNGKPSKRDYRHFNIKTVEGPNDFASMTEVVTRRYKKLIIESLPFPDLIVIDGGKGQLSAAVQALKDLSIYGQIPIIGIAKKLEELYYPEESTPLLLSKKSSALTLLQKLRDEAHRFAITFHRNKRSKKQLSSELLSYKGVGPTTAQKLLRKYGSVKRIKEADLQSLSSAIGIQSAENLYAQIHQKE